MLPRIGTGTGLGVSLAVPVSKMALQDCGKSSIKREFCENFAPKGFWWAFWKRAGNFQDGLDKSVEGLNRESKMSFDLGFVAFKKGQTPIT